MKAFSLAMLSLALLPPCAVNAAEGEKDPKVAAAAVTQALRGSREIDATKISVATHASVVAISGSVSNEAEAARVVSIAEKAADGVRISSNLEVPPSAVTADAASIPLVRAVQAALRRDARTSKLTVTVSIDDQQTIGLHGLVPSAADRAAAQSVAAQVKGVRKVENSLATSGQ